MAQPLIMKKTPPPYTLNKENDLLGMAGEAGGDVHTQKAPASKSQASPWGTQLTPKADLQFMSQQPSTVGQREPRS